MYKKYFKRCIDIIISLISMIVLSPVYLIISIYVFVFLGKPILFAQDRIGKNEKTFKLYKFRSMTNMKDANGNLLSESKRLTKAGVFLRNSSLDELPELWAVFTGKMSLIGPRPMPTYYGPYFYEEERKRHRVRGGLIPPESILMKMSTTYEEQFACEVEYAQNITFILDVKVFFMTFGILYKRIKCSHGGTIRPHLNVYRSFMNNQSES